MLTLCPCRGLFPPDLLCSLGGWPAHWAYYKTGSYHILKDQLSESIKKSISKQVKHKSYNISYFIYNSQYYMYQYYLIFIWLKNVLNIFFLIQRLKRFWTLNSSHLIFNNFFLIDRFLMWKTKCKNIFSDNWKLLKKCLFQKQNTI